MPLVLSQILLVAPNRLQSHSVEKERKTLNNIPRKVRARRPRGENKQGPRKATFLILEKSDSGARNTAHYQILAYQSKSDIFQFLQSIFFVKNQLNLSKSNFLVDEYLAMWTME